MQQRVALAAAMVHSPDVLILDEPTSALDPAGVIEIREMLRAARDAGTAIFFSSHQLSEVEEICDRVAFLRNGKLERVGTLEELTAGGAQVEIVARVEGRVGRFHADPEKSSDHRVRFVVSQNEQRECIESIWANAGEVLSVNPRRRSLEELFTESQGGR
jgi:ABC-2 type transport system ATP-binding protein